MKYQVTDKVRFYSIALNVLLLITTGALFSMWMNKPCPECYDSGITVTHHDTTFIKVAKEIVVYAGTPTPKKILKSVLHSAGKAEGGAMGVAAIPPPLDTSGAYARGYKDATLAIVDWMHDCSDSSVYDTTIVSDDNWRLYLKEVVTGNRIEYRRLSIADYRPVITTTVTVVKKEKWKFYLGGSFTFNQREYNRWGAGPSLALAIPKIGEVDYYFDAKNFSHTIGVRALIRFHK
jgi:hypothetical protein